MSKTKHKHLKTKIKIIKAILGESQATYYPTLSIEVEDLAKAFGFSDFDEMTELCLPEILRG